MKNVLMFIVVLIIVYAVWNVVKMLVGIIASLVLNIALILLFCYAVYAVYRMLTRQKIRY